MDKSKLIASIHKAIRENKKAEENYRTEQREKLRAQNEQRIKEATKAVQELVDEAEVTLVEAREKYESLALTAATHEVVYKLLDKRYDVLRRIVAGSTWHISDGGNRVYATIRFNAPETAKMNVAEKIEFITNLFEPFISNGTLPPVKVRRTRDDFGTMAYRVSIPVL